MFVMAFGSVVMPATKTATENLVDSDQALIRPGWDQGANIHDFVWRLHLHHRPFGKRDRLSGAKHPIFIDCSNGH